MELMSLPPELVAAIAKQVVRAIGIYKAFRIRSVNRLFNDAILRSIFNSQLVDFKASSHWRARNMSPPLMARLIHAKLILDPESHRLLSAISKAIGFLSLKSPYTDEQRSISTFTLCEVAAQNLASAPWGAFAFLRQGVFGHSDHPQGQQFWHHVYRQYAHTCPVPMCSDGSTSCLSSCLQALENSGISQKENLQNSFSAAIATGDMDMVHLCLYNGAEVNYHSLYFGRPLQIAARWGRAEIVQFLLDHDADYRALSGYSYGSDNVKRALFGQGVYHPDFFSSAGSALRVAVLAGHDQIVDKLFEPRYRVFTSGAEYGEVILAAVRNGNADWVKKLMEEGGRNAEALFRKKRSWTHTMHNTTAQPHLRYNLLRAAARHGHKDILCMLLIEKSNILQFREFRKAKALQALRLAVRYGKARVIPPLLDVGALSTGAKRGISSLETLMEVAVIFGHEEVAKILLERGCAVESICGLKLFHLAAVHGQVRIMRFLWRNVTGSINFGLYGHHVPIVMTAIELGLAHVLHFLLEEIDILFDDPVSQDRIIQLASHLPKQRFDYILDILAKNGLHKPKAASSHSSLVNASWLVVAPPNFWDTQTLGNTYKWIGRYRKTASSKQTCYSANP